MLCCASRPEGWSEISLVRRGEGGRKEGGREGGGREGGEGGGTAGALTHVSSWPNGQGASRDPSLIYTVDSSYPLHDAGYRGTSATLLLLPCNTPELSMIIYLV